MPESTTSDDLERAALPRLVWIGFAVLTAIAYLVGLNFPLVGPDEPRYAQVAREMMERGDWITPTLGGHTWFEKPALLYWLEIVSYKVFGVNEAAARLGPALFGIAMVVTLWLIGRSVRDIRGCGAGGYFALVAASTLGLLVFAHGASFDIIVTFPIAAALTAYWYHERGERPGLSLGLFYLFVGVSLLAKGLIGVVFPFGIVGFYHVLLWRLPSRRLLVSLIWGTLVAAAVASVWYVPVYLRHGWHFVDEFIIQHHFQRFTSNKYQHPQPFYFFFWVLPLMTLPWLPFFAAGLWKAAKRMQPTARSGSEVRSSLCLFALSWVVVPLVFFSISGSKLPGYILPAVPGAAILAALVVHRLASRSAAWKFGVVTTSILTLTVSLAAVLTVVPSFAADDSVKTLVAAADGQGYGDARVLMLHTVSHNAEFYAAGRVERDDAGQLIEHFGPGEIAQFIRRNGGPVLVLVPNEHTSQLQGSSEVNVIPIATTKELTIAAVTLR